MCGNMSIIADDAEGKVSIKVKNDERLHSMCDLLLDSGLWVRRSSTSYGEKYIWIDIQIPKEKNTKGVCGAEED